MEAMCFFGVERKIMSEKIKIHSFCILAKPFQTADFLRIFIYVVVMAKQMVYYNTNRVQIQIGGT